MGATLLLAGFATLLLILYIITQKTDKKLKNSPRIKARVLESVDERGQTTTPYRTVYEFVDAQGVPRTFSQYESKRQQRDAVVDKIAYKESNGEWTLYSIDRDNRSGKALILVLIAVCYCIAIGLFISTINENFHYIAVNYIFPPIMGIVFSICSISFINKGNKHKEMLKSQDTMQLLGTVLWNIEHNEGDGDWTYAPVYEYWIGDERRVHASSVATAGRHEIGSTTTLYYNRRFDMIVDKQEVSSAKLFAIVCAIAAIAIFVYFGFVIF